MLGAGPIERKRDPGGAEDLAIDREKAFRALSIAVEWTWKSPPAGKEDTGKQHADKNTLHQVVGTLNRCDGRQHDDGEDAGGLRSVARIERQERC